MHNQRLQYFDILKGVAIFLVVMGHVLTIGIRNIDNAFLFKIIGEIHMPLFFFISGYFTYKVTGDNRPFRYPQLKKRFLQLIVPFVTISSLWIIYFPHSGLESPLDSSWSGLYSDLWKNGYWFTLCLFEIILIYAATVPLLRRCKSPAAIMASTISVCILTGIICISIPTHVNFMTGLPLALQFFPIFMAGVIARKYENRFDAITSDSRIYTVALIVLCLMTYYVCYYWEFPSIPEDCRYVARVVLHLSLAIVAVALFKSCGNTGKANPVTDIFTRIGKDSLAIYLLHYFFLFPMGGIRQSLIDMGLGIVPTAIISAFSAAFIIAAVMMVYAIIKKSRILALLLTGKI